MKTFSEETRKRMSESAKRRCQTQKFKEQVQAYWEPFCTEEELRRDYEQLGMSQHEIEYKYGVTLKRVQTSMRRYGIKPRPAIKRDQRGPLNDSWKGDGAGYQGFHARLYRERGRPKRCEVCGATDPTKTYDWANLTGRYDDPVDYQRMCRSCHWKYDNKIQNITGKKSEVQNA